MKFGSSSEFVCHIEELHDEGQRFYHDHHPVVRRGLALCIRHIAHCEQGSFHGDFEAFIRDRVGKTVLEAAQSDGYVSSEDRTIAKLFDILVEPKERDMPDDATLMTPFQPDPNPEVMKALRKTGAQSGSVQSQNLEAEDRC
jgi:hypothetical protein